MYKKTALEFINKINAHDVDGIIRTISDDHVLIDAQSNELKGKDRLREGWTEYFVLFPDYAIEVEDVFEQDNKVAVFGFASGTYKGLTEDQANFWRVPAAWKDIIEKNKYLNYSAFFTPSRSLSCGKHPRLCGSWDRNKYNVFPRRLAIPGMRAL